MVNDKHLTNYLLVSEEDIKNEFKFDICLVIEELNKLPFDFYISGGVIGKFFLKEHARYTKDIDIVTGYDLKEVERIFREHFNVSEFVSCPITDEYYEEAFICLIEFNGKTIQIDGMKVDFFSEIKPEIYKINGISFKGVPFEYLLATKIHALIIEIERPFKHLVDVYSASLLNESLIDKEEIKRYLSVYNEYENKIRKLMKQKEESLRFCIEKNKTFSGPTYLTILQAGHNVSKEKMIEEVNKYLSTFK